MLLDGGHSGKSHWSNQLACKDLESHMHKRLIRDVQHFKGRLTSYEVCKGRTLTPTQTQTPTKPQPQSQSQPPTPNPNPTPTPNQVWKGALQWRDWIDRCGEALSHNPTPTPNSNPNPNRRGGPQG